MLTEKALHDTPWHTRPADEVVAALETDAERGLADADARARLERYGPNRIRASETVPWWRLLLRQFTDPLIYILLVATAVSLAIGEYVDASVIMAAVALNAVIGFVQEMRARTAIQALAAMSAPSARVLRDGDDRSVATEAVVPGDIVVLEAGALVPADARLVEVEQLAADESALTGEAEAVAKQREPVEDERAVPGDRRCMVFAGTTITRGRGLGVVVHTGEASELGQIAEATHDVGDVETPIERKMAVLGRAIGLGVVAASILLVVGGWLVGMPLGEIVHASVALAVGAVPEGLPVVLTVTLAVGVQRMARRNAIIRSLHSVETLGSTTVVASDKTGTLTANEMTVRIVWSGGERHEIDAEGETGGDVREAVRQTLLTGVLANEAKRLPREGEEGAAGDPTELALLVAARRMGFEPAELRASHRQRGVIPFTSERQYMATLNETPDGRRVFLKGSPEAVLARCTRQLGPAGEPEPLDGDALPRVASELADEGFRVLAHALRDGDALDGDDPGRDFVFAGFQGMADPVRPAAVEAVREAQRAGIRVLMLTGDHARTARAIGAQVGLGGEGDDVRVVEGRELEEQGEEKLDALIREVSVYARVSPRHKLRLVERLKAQGEIVAVTGDGVNDAPALRAAHLGIAMGRSGTDVAREASDMVLADDNFASITSAVEEGRVVFANIRKAAYFLLSTAIADVLAILVTLFAPGPLAFLPAQVLWINLVTNGVQDVALAFEKAEPGLLAQPPRDPREGVLSRPVLWRLALMGALMGGVTVAVFWWMLRQDASLELARSVAMTQLVMFQFFHVLNARSFHRSILSMPLGTNPFLAICLPLALLAHLAALYTPFMQGIFATEPLTLQHWVLVTVIGTLVVVVAEVDKVIVRRRGGTLVPARRAEAAA